MVVSALRMINVDTSAFTGVCCRMGGLTIATEAGVPENILWVQSGHAQDRAARRYVRLTNPDRLYDTSCAPARDPGPAHFTRHPTALQLH